MLKDSKLFYSALMLILLIIVTGCPIEENIQRENKADENSISQSGNSLEEPGNPGDQPREETSDILAGNWGFTQMTWKEADGTINPSEVWGDLNFDSDGTFKYVLHIGDFQNHHSGTFQISGDNLLMWENGKILHDFQFAVDREKGVLTMKSEDADGGMTVYEAVLKNQ